MKQIRVHGEVVEWSDEKRCGFVRVRGSGELAFLALRAFQVRGRTPSLGDAVTFLLVKGDDTRRLRTPYRAERVAFAGEEPAEGTLQESHRFLVPLGGVVLLAQGGYAALTQSLVAAGVFGASVLFSLLALVRYASDKRAAKRGAFRVAESELHFLSLLGGWPGASLAQGRFHHKNRKESFQLQHILMVVLNLAGTIGILTSVR